MEMGEAISPPVPEPESSTETSDADWTEAIEHPFTVVVPVYNPTTEQYLIELAALIAEYWGG